MRIRGIRLVVLVLILSLFGSLGLTYQFSAGELSFVVDSLAAGEKIYLIDDDNKEIHILETDLQGKITGDISLPKQKDGSFFVLDYLNADDGQVYVYKREQDIISSRTVSENVCLCDFAKGKLRPAWELFARSSADDPAGPFGQTVFAVKVAAGVLTYFTVDDTAKGSFTAQATLHSVPRDSDTPVETAEVNYDIGIGFTDLYYAENGDIVFTTPNGNVFKAAAQSAAAPLPAEPDLAGEAQPPDGALAASAGGAAEPQDTAPEPSPAVPEEPAEQQNTVAGQQAPAAEPSPATQEEPTEPIEFGREPSEPAAAEEPAEAQAAAAEPEPEPEKTVEIPAPKTLAELPGKEPLPEQQALDVVSVLARGLENEEITALSQAEESAFKARDILRIYPADTQRARLANFSADGRNTIYFMDLQKDGFYKIDLASGSGEAVPGDWENLTLADGTSIYASDLKNVRFTDDAHFTAGVETGDGNTVLGVFADGQGALYPKLTRTDNDLLLRGFLYFLGFLFAFLAIYILWNLFLLLTRGKVPIVTKLIAALIPVVIVGMLFLQNFMNNLFVQDLVEKQYKELFLVSRQQVDAISPRQLSEIDLEYPYDNVYYYELRNILNALPADSTLFDSRGEEGRQVYNFSYNWLYKVADGKLYSLFCDQNYIDVPVDYYYDRQTAELYYRAVSENKTIRGDFQDMGGSWIVLAIPLTDDSGKVYALMETGVTKAALEYAVREHTEKVAMVTIPVLVILLALLAVILLRSLAPLKQLRESVRAIINGQLGIQTPVRGRDEVAEIGRVFNQMSVSIESKVNELTDLNEGYYKFVPSKMFQLLRKSSVTDVRLGDQTNEETTILSFNVMKFEEMVSTMTGAEMFRLINRIYSNLVPLVNNNGGVVDKFENAGLVAFYTGGNERALSTAISVCQTMDLVNAGQGFGADRQIEMASGLSYGPVMIGIVGHQERLAATTISEHTNLSGYLRKIAPKYGSRILTTAAVISQIKDFDEKYNARFVGFLHISATDTIEKLYDVFDGDREDKKLFKKQTKELFEKGVSLYCQKEFYEARLVFIEVLKQFRQDAAAKEYLYRCDRYYQLPDTDAIDIFVESY